MRMSHARANSQPPPRQKPLIIAITGFGKLSIAVNNERPIITSRCVIEVRPEADRPQPRKDRDAGRGMTTVVGRVRPDPLLHVKFVCLSHNTIRGAAGGSILNAELLVAQGWVQ